MFYCFSWAGWIITTFLSKKNKKRLNNSLFLLLLICLSQLYIQISIFQFYIGGILVALYGILVLLKVKSSKILIIFYSIIIAMIYCIFHFLSIHDPTILFIPQEYMLLILLCTCCYFFTRGFYQILTIFIVGTFQGDLFLRYFLRSYETVHQIGTIDYLGMVAMGYIVFLSFYLISVGFSKIFDKNQYYEKGWKEL